MSAHSRAHSVRESFSQGGIIDPFVSSVLDHLRKVAGKKTRQRPTLSTDGLAYFIGPKGGPIKIGFSRDPGERLYRLQTAYPDHLHLWAEAEGGKRMEAEYHRRFAEHCIAGEWFTRCPEIEAEIARLVS